MKKPLFIASFLVILAIPSVTLAAWYNPLTWFKKTNPVVVSSPAVQENTQIQVPNPEELPAPKPVITNTITVEDPKLQSQINSLIKSNSDLQTELATVTVQYNSLVKQNASLSAQLASAQSQSSSQIATGITQIAQNTSPSTSSSISVSQGQSYFNGNAKNNISNDIFTNNFVIKNNSSSQISVSSVTYQLSTNGLMLGDTIYQQKMAVGDENASSLADTLEGSPTNVYTKDFYPNLTVPANSSITLEFDYSPSGTTQPPVPNPWLQVTIQNIQTTPSTTNNLPIINRATLTQ